MPTSSSASGRRTSRRAAPKRGANDEALAEYERKRDFSTTPEPRGQVERRGKKTKAAGGRFVVQRHRARRLHYDLRLELDDVLVSWAVPQGPTLDPGVRRLAVKVEDHPIEYADFEGVIPHGEYGGGDVIVWDRGTWTPAPGVDPARAIADGELHFDVDAEKLAGRFALVRTSERGGSGKEQWLLIHKHDEHAVGGWDPEDHPESVKSGLTNDAVAQAPAALWRSDRPAAEAEVAVGPATAPAPHDLGGVTEEELEQLAALPGKGRWSIGGHELTLTNLDKVLFPAIGDEAPVTKRELIAYAARIAPTILPYLRERPLNALRHPDGVDRPGFWQKQLPSHAPSWIKRWRNAEADPGETEWYVVPDSAASLAWLANYGVVELHPWTSTAANPHQPTWALVDIDPGPETSFDDVLVLARLHRTALEHLGLVGRPKVSGRRGVQIYLPLAEGYTFDETRAWVEALSRAVGRTVPELVSWSWRKEDRRGLARLDFTQNAINRTLVAPYSTRAAPGAPVSVPLEWDELDDPDLRPEGWTLRTVFDRLDDRGDPFRALLGVAQRVPEL
jgi:bifunctional non-homologous end joining protein LigD